MITTHSYTNDPLLADAPHKDFWCTRAASASNTPTTTRAAKSIGGISRCLECKINGMALRIPRSDGSKAVMGMKSTKNVINDHVDRKSKDNQDKEKEDSNGVMTFTAQPLGYADTVVWPHSYVDDGQSPRIFGDKIEAIKVPSYYDNERSFARRFVDPMKFVRSKVK